MSFLTADRLLRSVSLAYKAYRRAYHRTARKREIDDRRRRFYREIWQEAAAAAGASLEVVSGSLLEIRGGGTLLRVRSNLTSIDDPLTLSMAGDKPLVYRLLTQRAIPVPRHIVSASNDLRSAWEFTHDLSRPVVVKPARGTAAAIGVTTGVTGKLDLAWAMAYGGAFDRDLVIEETIEGDVFQLLFFDGELLDAVLRAPPTVRGDGVSTMRALIERENAARMEKGIEACQSLVRIDWELKHTLRRAGRGLRSIPQAGEVVRLKNVVNDNRGEDNESATERLCPEVIDVATAAAAAVGVRLAGVDVITPDPGRPLDVAGGAIIEVNTTPGYYYHYMKRDGRVPVAALIVERFMASETAVRRS